MIFCLTLLVKDNKNGEETMSVLNEASMGSFQKALRAREASGGMDTYQANKTDGPSGLGSKKLSSQSLALGDPTSGLDPSGGLFERYSEYEGLTKSARGKNNTLVASNVNMQDEIDKIISKGDGNTTSALQTDASYETSFKLINDLKKDFNISTEVAAGMVGNLWHETGGFKFMQELKPTSGRGGYQIAQWTGVRRKAFESYVDSLDLDINSYEAGYGFLKIELLGSEKRNFEKIKGATTVKQAATLTSEKFLRPGKPNLSKRLVAAEDIFNRYNEQYGSQSDKEV